ncbi:tRNA pseudouridine synthase-like 1 [Contarinia nasturtii]|uniref:tRNA pseudouridine synthase-like 1 n=1 Tax=Contarinia nasturtii TaxID=265458 RepID=UPI0012D4836A|nr:tRNA pseudouridine synthase-like 1 [Contarinia nasturtii]
MIRYLLNVSYIGTAYKGVTMIEPYYRFRDLRTVQGVVELAIKKFFKERCEVMCSSRTDARVHAIHSTFHFDVKQSGTKLQLETENEKMEIIATLNENLKYQNAAIRISDINRVDEKTFSAFRNVESRSYMYRIAITSRNKRGECIVPIEEVDRCYFVECDTFDMDKFKRAAQLFVGRHDFRSFMKYSQEEKTQGVCYAQRKLISVTVEPSKTSTISLNGSDKHFQFYDVTFTGNSFVYRQIRNIMGALCACAQNRITERDIYELLTIPSHKSWKMLKYQELVETAPAHGLYFIGINYKPEKEWTLEPIETSSRGLRMKSFLLLKDTVVP